MAGEISRGPENRDRKLMFNSMKKSPGTALLVVDVVIKKLPLIVCSDQRIVAALARQLDAQHFGLIRHLAAGRLTAGFEPSAIG
jgi:hypothetical protein